MVVLTFGTSCLSCMGSAPQFGSHPASVVVVGFFFSVVCFLEGVIGDSVVLFLVVLSPRGFCWDGFGVSFHIVSVMLVWFFLFLLCVIEIVCADGLCCFELYVYVVFSGESTIPKVAR